MSSRASKKSGNDDDGGRGNKPEAKTSENEERVLSSAKTTPAATASSSDSKPGAAAAAAANVAETNQEDSPERLEKRRAYNRMNAARARKRTKDQVVALVSKAEANANRITALERENTVLLDQVQNMSGENQRLRETARQLVLNSNPTTTSALLLGSSSAAVARPASSLEDACTSLVQHEHFLRQLHGAGAVAAASYGMLNNRGTSWLGGGGINIDPVLGIQQQSDTMRQLLTSSVGEAANSLITHQAAMGQQHRTVDDQQLLAAFLLQQSSGLPTSPTLSVLLGAGSQLMQQQQLKQPATIAPSATDAKDRQSLLTMLDAKNNNNDNP